MPATTVLMISPGFPYEQPYFTRGLASQGARVIGLGDQPQDQLPAIAKSALTDYWRVDSFTDEAALIKRVLNAARHQPIHQVECTWEPYMTLAAKLRQHLGVQGMTWEQTVPFRDKEVMKRLLDQAGIRTPRHTSTTSMDGVRQAAQAIGYPICVKPIAGAGSADTYRVDDSIQLEKLLPALRHVAEVSVEEWIEADEYTFDTICIDGQIVYCNISLYRPRPLQQRQHQWISPQTIALRDIDREELRAGHQMGEQVIAALGFQTGFTHMEWFRKTDGEVVFGEIAARPPGASLVDLMNFANDCDLYRGWAEAVLHAKFTSDIQRKYNSAHIIKRAQGEGRIQRITGLDGLMNDFGPFVCAIDLLPIGAPRRNWKQTLRSDGMIIVRHPDLESTMEIADQFGIRLQMYAS